MSDCFDESDFLPSDFLSPDEGPPDCLGCGQCRQCRQCREEALLYEPAQEQAKCLDGCQRIFGHKDPTYIHAPGCKNAPKPAQEPTCLCGGRAVLGPIPQDGSDAEVQFVHRTGCPKDVGPVPKEPSAEPVKREFCVHGFRSDNCDDHPPILEPTSAEPGEPKVDPLTTLDAKLWAEEFMRIWSGRWDEVDEGLMIAWFANAIMRGFDEGQHRLRAKLELAGNEYTHVIMLKEEIADLRAKLAERDELLVTLKRDISNDADALRRVSRDALSKGEMLAAALKRVEEVTKERDLAEDTVFRVANSKYQLAALAVAVDCIHVARDRRAARAQEKKA